MKRRITSLLLVLVMVLSTIPVTASATEPETVYISVSDDTRFTTTPDGTPLGFYPVKLEELTSIDLDAYGLGEYIYDADGDGQPELTALHLYIYVHEKLLGLDWSQVYVTGSAGSIYFAGGLFGFFDENLRYDYNGAYPAVNGWGLTADQIVLSDGDFLNIAHYTSWAFWGDSATGFHYITDGEGVLQHTHQLTAGQSLKLGLVRSYSDWANGGAPAFAPEADYTLFYGATYGAPEGTVTTDADGYATITFPTAGTWYVWADGGYGMENPLDIVSAPAVAKVNVKGLPDLHFTMQLEELDAPIYDGGIVNMNLAKPDDFGFLDDTAQSGQNWEQSFRVEEYDQYILYVDFYNDSDIVGWNVNGVNYLVDDAEANDDYWDLGNDAGVGYGFGYTDDNGKAYTEFYLILGVEQPYRKTGSWTVKPVRMTEQILDVIVAIESLGQVTLESGENLSAVWESYNALSATDKELVFNYAALEAAQAEYEALVGAQAVADRAAADAVEKTIAAIGEVTVFSGGKVQAARDAFRALTDAQKALVENETVLKAAEAALQTIYGQAADTDHKAIFDATAKYLAALGTPSVGSTGGEWMVIAMTRAGQTCPAGYYANVEKFVKENINEKEQLHRAKSTENSRVILALTAAGYDVTDVAGHNLLKGLTDLSYVKKQGINGPIWALIAFDSHNYEIPAGGNVTRETLVKTILDAQLPDGGWALSGQVADPDMTGMALQALAPYCKASSNADVQAAVDRALECLSRTQHENGGFGSVDGICTESCVQVVVALTALGIDPETDARFVKNGISVLDAMCQFAVEGGGFAHIPGAQRNGMATEQGQYALVAYYRMKNGQTAIYNMTDVKIDQKQEAPKPSTPQTGDATPVDLFFGLALMSLLGMAVCVCLYRKKA